MGEMNRTLEEVFTGERHTAIWNLADGSMSLRIAKAYRWRVTDRRVDQATGLSFMGVERGRAARTGGLGTFEIEIDDDWVLTAAHDYGFTRLVGECVDLLVRDIGWNVDEVARSGFAAELQVVPPAHPRFTADNVEDRFEFAVMMGPGFGIGLHDYRAGP